MIIKRQQLLIIGFGSHITKNILPALSRVVNVIIEGVLVRDISKYAEAAEEFDISLRPLSYLEQSEADWVYIATPISTHYDYVKKAISHGKNVICEKLLVQTSSQLIELYEMAETARVKLFEVCMYTQHAQFHHLMNTINKSKPKSIRAKFSIPHLAHDNIRYDSNLGGGALNDVGYYPISLAIRLFGKPNKFYSYINANVGFDVDLIGTATLIYDDFYFIAEWGIGVSYSNFLEIEEDEISFYYDRIFSKPPNYITTCKTKSGFTVSEEEIGSDDQFVNFFTQLIGGSADYAWENECTLMTCSLIESIRITEAN